MTKLVILIFSNPSYFVNDIKEEKYDSIGEVWKYRRKYESKKRKSKNEKMQSEYA